MTTPIADGTVPWPEDLAREYTKAGWWRGQTLGAEIAAVAAAKKAATALVDGANRISYASLAARADALASRLTDELGLERGDRIVVQLPNCWQFVVLTLGCLRAGIVPVMALPAHREHELAYLCEHSEARALAVPDVLRDFDHEQMAERLRADSATLRHILVVGQDIRHGHADLTALSAEPDDAAAERARWDAGQPEARDVAVFLLSGGTTGLPKLIARTHNDYSYNARASAELCGLGAGTVYLAALPASHNFPLACPGILGTLLSGGRVVMLASPQPQSVFAAIEQEGVTITAVVPAVAQRWLAHAEEHGSTTLRVLQVGGARLADELARRVRPVLGATLQQVFGMAEGLLNYTRLDDPDEVICGTQGGPLSPGDEVRIVDGGGNDLPDGQAGVLLTRGPYTPRGYYRAPEQNARAFTPDGWYASGDVVRRRPDGNLVVEGRDKDMINRGGEKISAEEVENLVYRMPGIAQVAAVAAPDAELGERICVFVVPQPGQDITLSTIRDGMAAAGVARFKWPERLEVIAELPVTKVGKLDKKALRDMLAFGRSLTMTDTDARLDGTGIDSANFDSAEHQAQLTELYRDFEAAGMTPLWLTREGLMPFHPQPRAVPHLWRWADLLPLAARSAELVPVGRGGERRAISLGNPGLPGDPYTTPTLWAAIQYLAPREDAPEHRHSQSAFRFVLEGEGVWTVVDGDPVAMRRGDLLLTPGWQFHGHQNVSDTPMAWLDGLDIPLVAETDQGFFEFGPDQVRTRATPERSNSERLWGLPGLTPVALAGTRPASPLVAYRWAHTDAALTAQLELEQEGIAGVLEPGHAAIRYTNPTSGGDALTTMRTEFHRLRAGAATRASRTSASSVWQVFDGAGSVRLDGTERPLERGDIIAVPAWTEFSLRASSQLDLFTFSDAPVFEKLNLLRTEVTA